MIDPSKSSIPKNETMKVERDPRSSSRYEHRSKNALQLSKLERLIDWLGQSQPSRARIQRDGTQLDSFDSLVVKLGVLSIELEQLSST